MGRLMPDLLRRDGLVLELWWDGAEYRCLASRGREPARDVLTAGGPTVEEAIRAAIAMLGGEPSEVAKKPPRFTGELNLTEARRRVDAGESLAAVARGIGLTRATLYHRLRKEAGTNVSGVETQQNGAATE